MIKCPSCGAENNDGNKYCEDCGAFLKSSKPSDGLISRFKNASLFKKIVIIICAYFIFSIIFTAIMSSAFLILGIPVEQYTEADETQHLTEFNLLDTDGDGGLSFSEVNELSTSDMDNDELSKIFRLADKNNNGLLKGSEFDNYLKKFEKYFNKLEKQKSDELKKAEWESQKASEQQNQGKSDSQHKLPSWWGHESCPECGSEEIWEEYDEFDRPYWFCSSCDAEFSSDELYDNYFKKHPEEKPDYW